jgi:hypothetical protein
MLELDLYGKTILIWRTDGICLITSLWRYSVRVGHSSSSAFSPILACLVYALLITCFVRRYGCSLTLSFCPLCCVLGITALARKWHVNVVVEWLTLRLRIRKVPRSNLGLEIVCLKWRVSWFSLVSPTKCWNSALRLGHDRFLPHPFQFIIYHAFIRCWIVRVTEKRQ